MFDFDVVTGPTHGQPQAPAEAPARAPQAPQPPAAPHSRPPEKMEGGDERRAA